MTRLTRREALISAALATALAGCGASHRTDRASTLESTWADPLGTGNLERAPGEPLLARRELGPPSPAERVIATLAHITDAHILDASSPARVPFLDRLGSPFESTFRPQEALTAQVLAGTVWALRGLRADAVIQGGDLIDNAQRNELIHALRVLAGGLIRPGSGPHGYFGVQLASNPDPFYYRPDLDAPRHPGLLARAVRAFFSQGLGRPTYPVLGDHDILVQGEIPPTAETRALAIGDQALWELPPGLIAPSTRVAGNSPDGPPSPVGVSELLAQALAGSKQRVPPDTARRQLESGEVITRLGRPSATLDYHADVGAELRLIMLDLARRDGGSGGLVRPDLPPWLERELAAAGPRWILAVSHQPLASSEGGEQLLALLDHHPRVIAALSGHTHRNEITPRPTPSGGYWLINTASLIDYPQQARALRVIATRDGRVAIQTWMLDHVFPGELGTISRELAYLDAQGGRPKGFAGSRLDRNVTLYL
jgi:3',5'-cyclic AMP phosphodiesterase CpdA